MTGFGTVEILIVLFLALIGLVIPVASLVLIFLIYNKLNRVEQFLNVLKKEK
jgi:hypothetical protein